MFVLPAMVHYQTTTEGLSLTLLSSSSAAVSYNNPRLQSLRQIVYFCSSVYQQSEVRLPLPSLRRGSAGVPCPSPLLCLVSEEFHLLLKGHPQGRLVGGRPAAERQTQEKAALLVAVILRKVIESGVRGTEQGLDALYSQVLENVIEEVFHPSSSSSSSSSSLLPLAINQVPDLVCEDVTEVGEKMEVGGPHPVPIGPREIKPIHWALDTLTSSTSFFSGLVPLDALTTPLAFHTKESTSSSSTFSLSRSPGLAPLEEHVMTDHPVFSSPSGRLTLEARVELVRTLCGLLHYLGQRTDGPRGLLLLQREKNQEALDQEEIPVEALGHLLTRACSVVHLVLENHHAACRAIQRDGVADFLATGNKSVAVLVGCLSQSLLGNVVWKLEDIKSPQTPTTALFLTELEGEDSLRLSDIEEQEEELQTARSPCSIGHSSSRSAKAMVDLPPLCTSARHVLEVIQRGQGEVIQRGQVETSGDQQAVLFRKTILQVHQCLSDTGPAHGPAHQKMGHLLHLFHLAAVQSRLINALGMSEQTGRANDGDHRRRKDGSSSSFSSSSSSCEEDPVRRATPGEAWGVAGSSGYSPAGSRWSPVSTLSLREQRQALEVLTRVLTAKVEDRLEEMCEDPEKAWDTVLRGVCLSSMNNPSADVTIREEEPSTSPALGINLDQSPAKETSSHSLSLPVQPGVTGDAAAAHRPETESVSDDERDEDEVEKEEEETVTHHAPHFFIVLPDSYKDFPLNDDITASDSNSNATESPNASVAPGDQENGSGIPPLYNCGGRDVDSTDIDEDNPMTPTECDRELRSQSPLSYSSSSEEEVHVREELLLDVPRATAIRRLTLKNVIHGVMTALSTGGALRSTNEEDHLETEKILLKKVRVLLKRNAGFSVTCNKQEVSGHFKSFAAVNGMIQSASKELLLDWNTRQLHPTRRGVAETLARVILVQGGRCVIPQDYYGPFDLEDDLEEEEEEHWYDSFWKSRRPPTELDKRYGLIEFSQSCSSSTPARNTQIRGRVNSLAGLAKPTWTPMSLKDGDCYTKHNIAAIKVAPSSNVGARYSGHTSTLSSSTGSQKKALKSSRRPSQERASLGFPRGVDCLDTQMTRGTTGQASDKKTSSKTKKKGMVQVEEEGKGKRQKNGKNNADLLSSAHAATEEEKVKPKTKPTLRQRFKSARKSFRLTLARIFCCGPPV